jgi:uncharacterized Fe-S cluster-containing radical SAM superfamily protein
VSGAFPQAPLLGLDTLWIQAAGTLCNIACAHCFISSSPTNRSHEMLSREAVRGFLAEAEALGVKEYYFTGGEPFLNRELLGMLEDALALGPVSVLTNAMLIRHETASRLRELQDASEYSLDLRVSLDGWDAPGNDALRGAGSFERALQGIRCLAEAGINPVLTVTAACEAAPTAEGRTRLLGFLRGLGLRQPRLKVMPLLRLGAEVERSRAYAPWESLSGVSLAPEQAESLVCASGRCVTSRGVYVCPILIDFPGARMGQSLAATRRPFSLAYRACYTCHVEGLSCRT